MRLYQPVLFVGLGGTGCDIGAELERRLREEICGPDGNDFSKLRGKQGMLPYQLPSCVQFVYADMNQAELDRLPRRVVPGPEHLPAAALNAHYVTGLLPNVPSYPELATVLRLQAGSLTESWLPPPTQDEPKVNPLHRGAGQFPTIGRAALFGTFLASPGGLSGIGPATRDIHAAVGELSNSGEDLYALAGKPPRGVDVFVAFSVAGGTGSGIFYDYLHLIAHTLRQNSSLRVKIYPLVLMPSAFDEGLGGGRPAELNAGRALLDLFRLVDQQNGADAQRELRGADDQRPADPEEVSVNYPGNVRIVMAPGTLQTGFLFSQPAGATREDMHRSIVSLVMSLVGTEMSESDDQAGEQHQSFADSFVNQAAHRQVTAENGIGNRGVSTALVASLTVPVDELAGIVAARLLRSAVSQISTPNGKVE
ncbi:MAG TPA: tubulin-like doman-containing protein, partial [Streptosporangiaceae bacterium]|nr:tubulin-like doman-containing protein [Streptosporangiaceae bacterium]